MPSVPVWDDGGRQRISTQAAQLIIGFNYFEASKALDPYWSAKFWQWIEPTLGVLVPEIRTLLEGHGYVGAVNTSAPRNTFRREVESHRDTGAPPHGAGGAIAWTPTSALQATTPPQGTAWQYQLQPDLKRGAPEIYRSLRSAGSASVRNWLIISFQGSKQSDKWLELWNLASTIDFRLGRCSDSIDEMKLLATDDFLEIGLRRLAAQVYEDRTHDKAGAKAMLAIQAPGAATDIAPAWMVSDATVFSKAEHQRAERVTAASRGRGTGGGSYGGGSNRGGGGGAGPRGRGNRGGGGGNRGRGNRGGGGGAGGGGAVGGAAPHL